MCKISPMKVRTIAMMLMLLVAGLAIGCSSEPAAPAAPVPNLTENEAIAIARSSEGGDGCFLTNSPKDTKYREELQGSSYRNRYTSFTNFTHSQSASLKPSGIWIVTAKSSWTWEDGFISDGGKKPQIGDVAEHECTIIVDDVIGLVTSN